MLAPVTLVAAGAFGWAWWRGAPPRRVYLAARWCLPMVAAWLAAVAAWPAAADGTFPAGAGPGAWWLRVAAAPFRAGDAMWRLIGHGHPVAAAVAAAPRPSRSACWPAAPAGRTAGSGCGAGPG